MICRACLRARGGLNTAFPLPPRAVLQATQIQTRSLSTAAPTQLSPLPSSSRVNSIPLQRRPTRQHFSTSSPTSAAATPTQETAAPAPSSAPEKPTYLSEGESLVWDRLLSEFSPTELVVQDISGGCGSMYGIEVSSEKFRGLTMLKQQRLVNAALGDLMKDWHGVQLKTRVP